MAAETPRSRTPWLALLVSCAWPLVIPIGVYSIRLRNVRIANRGSSPWVQEILAGSVVEAFVAVLVVAVALSLLTCGIILLRRRASRAARPKLGLRILGDIVLILAFFASPWLVVTIFDRRILDGEIASLWAAWSALWRTIPCFCAVLAGLSFAWATARLRGRNVEDAKRA